MTQDLRETVARAIARKNGITLDDPGEASERHLWLDDADAAIAAVIEWIAAEAEAEPFMDFTGDWDKSSSEGFAAWLRAHVGGMEATDE